MGGSCTNDATFYHGSDRKQTCSWIGNRQDRVFSFCQAENVRSKCPQVCGLCCVDDPGFKFSLKRQGVEKTCQWLKHKSVRQDRYCNNNTISDACPISCGTDNCPGYVPISNVTTSNPALTCSDNKYYSMGGRKRTCHWMGLQEERRYLFCQSEEVRNNCPFSCGVCCKDDSEYTFTINRGEQKKCIWLGKKSARQDRYCDNVIDGMSVSERCPKACGRCKSPYDNCGETKTSKAPSKQTKSEKSIKNGVVLDTKVPKKGSKATEAPSAGSKTKSSKKSSKGKGSKCTQAPTQAPAPSPISFSEIPSSSPTSASPTSSPSEALAVVFSIDICTEACRGVLQSESTDLIKASILENGLGIDGGSDISVTINTESSDCSPCENTITGRRNRFLQAETLLANSVVFKVTTPTQDAFEPSEVIENLNNNVQNINEAIAESIASENRTETIFLQGDFEVATTQPTQSPTQWPSRLPTTPPTPLPTPSPTDAPSPAPQDLTTRKLAEQMNHFYEVSSNIDLKQDKKELRDLLQENFQHAQDVEDIFMRTHDMNANLIASPRRRLSDFDGEDYYADLPNFITQDNSDPLQCKCVDCDEDAVCGGLWKAERYPAHEVATSQANSEKNISSSPKAHVIVSYCKSSLKWINSFIKGHNIMSIHIVSKCGEPVVGAPDMATIEILPNVGRCDHTYAYYITNILNKKVHREDEENSIVVFLKDDISSNNFHQSGHWNDFGSMIQLASSDNGFACGIVPGKVDFGPHSFFLSAYHEAKTLFDFSMSEYGRNLKGYASDGSEFKSIHHTLGSWYASLGIDSPHPEVVQVCYGGVFAASVSNIMKRNMGTWRAIEESLSRGNNIQEGHYAERSWASLLSTPLQPFQVEALMDRSDGIYINKNSMHGALLKRPKLYLHIGVEGTSSTELLTESLVADVDNLNADGYNVAVHGKWDGGIWGFPNVDRLGSCMWSDINKNSFPEHLKEATICPENTLPDLTEYMKQSAKASRDVVMLNPWLIRPGTALSLGTYFDPVWEVNVVIYYRRYYEWITIKFDDWRQEVLEYTLSPHKALIPLTSFRYIDFLREYCKRLFYGKNINENGFPVRELDRFVHVEGETRTQHDNGKVYFNQFDPTTNFEVEELTDLEEYTYFAAKQYYANSRFRHGINIVNYHDIRGPETNFYCHVLHDAHNACKAAVKREKSSSEPLEMEPKAFAQLNPVLPFKPAHALEEIVVAGYMADQLYFDETQGKKKFVEQVMLWINMVHSALQEKNLSVTDLPVECLYQFEIDRLLEVSLAYERALLPGFFGSSKGADNLKDEFSRWRFCSVDTTLILSDPRWKFLFEAASDYILPDQPKAYIHIGAPKTGSTSIQDTMAMDKDVLKEDKYFLAMHGQVTRKGKPEEYIIDNMLVQCDRLGACVWSDEQREMVVQGSGNRNAGVCPDFLPPVLDEFLSKAIEAKSNVVISNEWLNRPTSETGLLTVLEGWDPVVVIYYRRFFDWMISAHYQWHFDIGLSTVESLQGKVRLIDFIRMFCGRLFASKVQHSASDSDLSFVDLTDVQEYTYHAWKRYNKVPEYENNVKIVNFHDGHIIKSFYCDVLGAKRACELETSRLESHESVKTRSKASTTYIDLAIGLYSKDTSRNLLALESDKGELQVETISMKTFQDISKRFEERMTAKGFVEGDLPKECLTKSEQDLLLNVSLAYEKLLLPESYGNGGEEATREHFARTLGGDKFCSVDLEGVLGDPKWDFLFENDIFASA